MADKIIGEFYINYKERCEILNVTDKNKPSIQYCAFFENG